jgi:hypothetical protein
MYGAGKGNGLQSCAPTACSVPPPGFYIKTACSTTHDAVIRSCAEYPGNKQSMDNMSPEQQKQVLAGVTGVFDVDRFYCPAGNLVLPLPAHALAVAEYTAFECKPGFHLREGSCLYCPPGSACVGGVQSPCPANYYNDALAASSCRRCTVACGHKRRPLRCGAGSVHDGGCVSCGACGYSADTGLACVENNYEMQSLKPECSPSSQGQWNC